MRMTLQLKNYFLTTTTLAFFALPFSSWANVEHDVDYHFHHSNVDIQVDGELNEAVWQHATKMDLTYNINPGDNTPAPVKTEVMLFENGDSIFIAFNAQDNDPEAIRSYYHDRDNISRDDRVGIVLDTFNDERRAFQFFVNPYGVQEDSIKDDSNGGQEDRNWDAIWDSAGRITENGYVVEMEIPFKALRFPGGQQAMTWGIDAKRYYPRDSNMVLASNPSERGRDCNLCQISKINGLNSLEQGKNFQLTPTVTASRRDEKKAVPGEWQKGDFEAEAGLDLRWGINQNLYLNATITPDFSTVEADAAQLDVNNTFSLFTREKRPFFLDGKDYFNTQQMNLVHTRNINAPDYGVKLTGKSGDHTYGFFTANDDSTSFLMPGNLSSGIAKLEQSSEVLVGRYQLDVGERSNIGTLITNRSGEDYDNTVASIDGRYQFDQENSLSYQLAYSDTENPQQVVSDFKVERLQSDLSYSMEYQHRTRDYSLRASYTDFGKDFRADLGFVGKNNFKQLVLGGRYTWYGEEGSDWTRWGIFGDWDKTYDQDGLMLEEEIELHANIQGPMQFETNFGLVHTKKYWQGEYYNLTTPMFFVAFDPVANLTLRAFGQLGDQIDYANNRQGERINLELRANLKIGKHASTELRYNHRELDVTGGQLFSADQVDLRFNYQFNLNSAIRLVVQHTDIDRNLALYNEPDSYDNQSKYLATQLLYSYKLNPQSLFYLGYSDNGYQDDELTDIEQNSRQLFMKISYAWQL